jgi:integrase
VRLERARQRRVEKTTKSKAGTRVLPLPAPVVAAVRAFRKVQAAERLAAGEGYTSTGYVLVVELGLPQSTDWLRRRAYEQMAEHAVRRVRWYSTRHACLTFLAASRVPVTILAAWAGHADGGALAMRTYVKPNAEHLRGASDALAQLLG